MLTAAEMGGGTAGCCRDGGEGLLEKGEMVAEMG